MITSDSEWVYFNGADVPAFNPVQAGDQLRFADTEAFRPYRPTEPGAEFFGGHDRRRPRRNCTREQLALAGVSVEPPTYEHYL